MYNSNFALLTRALQTLLAQNVLANVPGLQISTAVPGRDFQTRLGQNSAPVLNLYLTGIRQDLSRRMSDPGALLRAGDNKSGATDAFPRVIALTYMVTAWSSEGVSDAEMQQDLLYRVLQGMTNYPELPEAIAKQAGLDTNGFPVQLDMLHERDGGIRSGDYWSALGTPPRPLLELTALIPIQEGSPATLPLIRELGYDAHPLQDAPPPTPPAQNPQISGIVSAPFPPNLLQLQLRGMETGHRSAWIRPDAQGRFSVNSLPDDDYMIRLAPDDKTLAKKWWGPLLADVLNDGETVKVTWG
ncbi:hypothetical protein BUE93_21830 [Chromobacterium amazonense]|uniref:Pvc16 N-terminal domain-containing protein n=1 Tax=Chromobacterium amazonense TaxID=1382803 RepID=A0A2S9WYI2_9NEIS|nr:Pvc16 family protein [Chromobacterium amazonense]PRP68532.1 hypothetical protein BUE93_21830 [Chromobacterium amazonense]